MATAITRTSAPFQLKAGLDHSPEEDITAVYTAGDSNYRIGYDSRPWLTTDTLTLTVQFSPDNGVTWGWGGAETTSGGSNKTSKGVEIGCAVAGTLPGSPGWPTPDGWPANPSTVLCRAAATVPTTQTTTATLVFN